MIKYLNRTFMTVFPFCQGASVPWTKEVTVVPDSQISSDIVDQIYQDFCHDENPGQTRFAPQNTVWLMLLRYLCQIARSLYFKMRDFAIPHLKVLPVHDFAIYLYIEMDPVLNTFLLYGELRRS